MIQLKYFVLSAKIMCYIISNLFVIVSVSYWKYPSSQRTHAICSAISNKCVVLYIYLSGRHTKNFVNAVSLSYIAGLESHQTLTIVTR